MGTRLVLWLLDMVGCPECFSDEPALRILNAIFILLLKANRLSLSLFEVTFSCLMDGAEGLQA